MKEILYLREVYEILTVKQIEAVEALIEHGSERKAAEALGKSKTAINSAVQIAKSKAAKSGYEPVADLVHKTANGFAVTGVSTAYKADGSVGLQWVKQSPDKALALQAMMTAIESYEWRPAPVIKLGSHHDKDLCTLITLTDFHLGMYSWAGR